MIEYIFIKKKKKKKQYNSTYVLDASYFIIRCFEDYKPFASRNKIDGQIDVGFGFSRYVYKGNYISFNDACDVLYQEVIVRYNIVQKKMFIHECPLSAGQQIALTSLAYNMSPSGFASRFDKHFRAKNIEGLRREHLSVNTSHGVPQPGLVYRRGLEGTLFNSGDQELDANIRKILDRYKKSLNKQKSLDPYHKE